MLKKTFVVHMMPIPLWRSCAKGPRVKHGEAHLDLGVVSVEGVLDGLDVGVGQVLEQNGVASLRHRIASVILSGDDGRESHAGGRNTLDEDA
jgi:hypothetical protein